MGKKSKLKPIEVCITINGQDCSTEPGNNPTPEQLEAMAKVFMDGAQALRERKHGQIILEDREGDWLAMIGLDDGREEAEQDEYEYPTLSRTVFN
jgi:hypothetical protein